MDHIITVCRHHVYKRDGKDIELKEVGPRFELKCKEWIIILL